MQNEFDWKKLNDEFPLTREYDRTGFIALSSQGLHHFKISQKPEGKWPYFVFENPFDKDDFEGVKDFSTHILEFVRDEPITFFAEIKECFFLAESAENQIDDRLMDLATWASFLGIPFKFFLKENDQYREISVMEEIQNRLSQIKEERILKIKTPSKLTISGDYGSSGLWGDYGMVSYDSLDLPFEFIRRLTVWAESYWNFLDGPCTKEWCAAYRHLQELFAEELRIRLKIKVDSIP